LDQPAPIDDDGALSPPMLLLAPEAKAGWIAFHDAIERELANGGELYDVRDVASKSADNAARLAALFQIFEHGLGGAVGFEAFEGASRVVAWHLNEARRFFGELALAESLANAVRLDSWLINYCQREHANAVSRRKVRQFGPNVLREPSVLHEALHELKELDRVQLVNQGRRTDIRVNPMLLLAR
jgi:putative DNA primase/helicase